MTEKPVRKKKLLIVEENPTIQDLLEFTFGRKGYEVFQSSNPRLALAQYHREPTDLIITDIRFSDGDGIQFLESMKRLDNDAAIILISTHEDFELAQRAVSYGVYDLIGIPFDLDRVVQSVHNALEKRMLLDRQKVLIEKHITMIEKLHVSYLRLKEMDKLKDDFLATVSHELLTPLTVIKTLVYNLLKGVAGELQGKMKDYIGLVKENSDRLEELLQEILSFSKLDAGRVRLEKEVLDIGTVAANLVRSIEPVANHREVSLSMEGCPAGGKVYADRIRLEEVLTNLIANAIKFTPRKGKVTVGIDEHGDQWLIHVKDTGFGIAPEHLDKIFTPFLQFNREQIQGRQGVGLGLAITKKLIDLHGGTIQVTSRLGKGSTFTVIMPKNLGRVFEEETKDGKSNK